MSKLYFSCPEFTVLLMTRGPVIVEAAPVVKRFEGQTIEALKSWVQDKFGGPIIVEELRLSPECGRHARNSRKTEVNDKPTGVRAVSNNDRENRRKEEQSPHKEPSMICPATKEIALPYGTKDLDPRVICVSHSPRRVRCYVRGCRQILRTPTRYDRGEVCTAHGIRCHFSCSGTTYAYADVRGNIIASRNALATRVIGQPIPDF